MSDESPPPDDATDSNTTSARFGSQLLDRVIKAKDQAAATAVQVKNQASVKAGEVSEQVTGKANDLRDASVTKAFEILGDFNAALPVLAEAGYVLSSVDIALGLPPKIVASFAASSHVSLEKVESLMSEHAEKKFTLVLMKSLHQAWQVQMKVKIAGLQPRGIAIELGLIPSVTVRFA